MKNLLLILLGAVIAVVLIAAGWFLGMQTNFMKSEMAVTFVDKALAELAIKDLMLSQLREGKLDEVKESLQLEINGNILTIDAFQKDMDGKHIELSNKILARIGKNRAMLTNSPSRWMTNGYSDVEAKVQTILKQAVESQAGK